MKPRVMQSGLCAWSKTVHMLKFVQTNETQPLFTKCLGLKQTDRQNYTTKSDDSYTNNRTDVLPKHKLYRNYVF